MIEIVMFTGENCGKCKYAKFMLESCPADVKIIERNVDKNEDYRNELKEKYGSMTLPTLVIHDKPYIGFEENLGEIMEVVGV